VRVSVKEKRMRLFALKPTSVAAVLAAAMMILVPCAGAQTAGISSPSRLLPVPAGWKTTEAARIYRPDDLFEYINGAAENYLSYQFRELAVGQYEAAAGRATMTVEIYDMSADRNAFGIYGSERFSESRFLPFGVQGYIEDGALNFLAGRFYVKLLSFEGGAGTEDQLKTFAAAILKGIGDAGSFPRLLSAFPREGLVANSEKYILRDFLGMAFLSNGFTAEYRKDGLEAHAFLIEGKNPEDAAAMEKRYLDQLAAKGQAATRSGSVARAKDPYLANILVARTGRFLCGATKVKDGALGAGEALVAGMVRALSGM
jgi:hypothetical protein